MTEQKLTEASVNLCSCTNCEPGPGARAHRKRDQGKKMNDAQNERPQAACVHRQLCYEAALQPRPEDDVEFYLFAVRENSSLLPLRDSKRPRDTLPLRCAAICRALHI